jgi:transglutaminase-like putative cysteine protease
MAFDPIVTVAMRPRLRASRGETALRYFAAYGCTLTAVIAAQLSVENQLVLALAAITLLGLPISLALRWSRLRLGRQVVSGLFINSLVVTMALLASAALLFVRLPLLSPHRLWHTLMLSQGPGESIGLLMQVILIFAVSRCLAIVSDKDAVWCAIPSFSVLLLLIVVHRGPEVVAYFLLWALLAAMLFAVDHRAEARAAATGTVPSVLPGQDVLLSARGLGSVLGFSLLCAMLLSYTVSTRDPENRGVFESWIIQMAGRMTSLALNLPEVSVSAGPERQIDFSSGPALPTNTPLWRAQAQIITTGRVIRPLYWRMFTLSQYNGTTWSQAPGSGEMVPRRSLSFFMRRPRGAGRDRNGRVPDGRVPGGRVPDGQVPYGRRYGPYREGRRPPEDGGVRRDWNPRFYYDIAHTATAWPRHDVNMGVPRVQVFQELHPLVSVTGYIPALPSVEALRLPVNNPSAIRVRRDGAVDTQVLQGGQDFVQAISRAPVTSAYGVGHVVPPLTLAERPNPGAYLTPEERRRYLEIYDAGKLARVRRLARAVVRRGAAQESDYARARRLAAEIQRGAVYTLRPPVVPAGRDAADFFLFEGRRRGYCTYFAGALTMMCRTVGIPARIVSGFAAGEWQDDVALLRESNAHAWTEVWVPHYGWAIVDATPAGERGDNAPSWYENWSDLFSAALDTSRRWIETRIVPVTMVLIALIGLTFAFLSWRRGLSWWPRRLSVRAAVSEDAARRAIFDAYGRASRQLARRFRRRASWETPLEWTQAAESTLRLQNAAPLRQLTQLYLLARYSGERLGTPEGEAARAALRDLDWRRQD